ncbi:hypothetical protein QH494_03780 [Sphingomonas sp. AR_OL41]|uniref:hypothetical protein n=1 Tax=Sphingomonas sp. AR_OL41 TaxID=3042729 RepID=UPI002480D4C3|nr:hypothetical protein [Sphingomonas sp. AR_OL41]MDH7971290.1 hypothetical protein [Sphingomonas sp. AR_OL41]
MKAFRVDRFGITEVDMPDDFDDTAVFGWDWDWDCVRLGNGHDAWVRDDALFQPGLALATFGEHANVPLPAYVLGADGERTVAATISLDDLSAQVSMQDGYR